MGWNPKANLTGPPGDKGNTGAPGQGFGKNAVEYIPDASDSEWDQAFGYRDSTGAARVFIGRRKNGTYYPDALNGGGSGGSSTASVVRWGDSLTANSADSSPDLASRLGRAVVVQGIGGQLSQSIAARQGGVPSRATVQGGIIPASGSVTVTLTVPIRSDVTITFPVTIAGVAGTFIATDSAGYLTGTFTRTTAGLPAVVPDGTPVQTGFPYRDMWPIYWYGRNNIKTAGAAAQIISDLRGSLEWNNRRDHALILSIPPFVGEEVGTTIRTTLDGINAAIRDAFPREFVDLSARLRNPDVITATGNTPTQQDLTDIANGLTPTVFRTGSSGNVDAGHFGPTGYLAINMLLAEIYTSRGWK
jgi:hypothetical protein